MQTITEMTELLQRYLRACESRDVARIANCFASDAVIEDPLNTCIQGRAEIEAYFHSLYDDLVALELTTSPIYWCRNTAACRWEGCAKRRDGTAITYEGVDVFVIDDTLRIARMSAYWDPKDFLD